MNAICAPGLRLPRGPRFALRAGLLLAATLTATIVTTSGATIVTLLASKDNTLYENATGAVSNGAGEYLFTGRTKDGVRHRGVIAFDIAAAVPAGSTINSVTLQLHLSREANTTTRITSLYRLTAGWGEGTSNAGQNEGQGAPSTTNDATWIHRFYPSTLWTAAGGDFTAGASASLPVTGNGFYSWTSSGMVLDAQAWLDTPSANDGWLIECDESVVETSKRFDSRENGQAANRPTLTVDYSATAGTGACCVLNGTCSQATSTQCAQQGGTFAGSGTSCTPDPCPVVVTLPAVKDNTLYESATGALSNGAGSKLLTSKNSGGLLRRGLLQFDLSSIPSGAAIQSVTVTLYNAEATNSATVSLHKAAASWGEGTSLATGTEDAGAPPATGDATWIHRFYPATGWTAAGGDFNATASASSSVVGIGSYSWSSAQLTADVQSWVDSPATHFGWVVRGKESGAGNALKRFESRQSTDTVHRPRLDVSYLAPVAAPTGACCLPNGTCDTLSSAQCVAAGGAYQGDGSSCSSGLCPVVLTPYVDSLPRPAVAVPVSGVAGGVASYVMNVQELSQRLHRDLPLTRVWGYNGGYPGPTIEATKDAPVTVTWVNDLRDANGVLRTSHYLPVDLCLKGPDTEGASARVVFHLHGGHVPAAVDGHPDATILPGSQTTYVYPNHQSAATLWYHDHAMGITRLNVMMGLAGFYLLRDPVENALPLPSGEFEVPLAIQDRTFNSDGSLQYPAMWMDHFFGDKMLVNGKVWPYLRVKQGKYRFRLLDGCNSRVLHLSLSNGASFQVIGTEQGLLPAPVTRTSLLLTPGERATVVIDFASYAPGTQIVLANDAPAPYPGNPSEGVIPNVMRFEVIAATGFTAPVPTALVPVTPLTATSAVLSRDFVLRKSADPCAGNIWLINGLPFEDVTERPVLGTTEIWRFINESGTTHPMHMHLVAFQVLDRQPFTLNGSTVVPTGSPLPPDASEAGWKDTAPVGPNEILRVIAHFDDYAGTYPYHCHILEHEDNEMMRQLESVTPPVLSVGDATLAEGNTGTSQMTFTLSLSSAVQAPVRVIAFTANGTASAGSDFTPVAPETLVIPALATSATVSVPILGDGVTEPDETFTLRLTASEVAVLGDSIGVGTIVNDDAVPTATIDDVTVPEGTGGTATAIFHVSLSAGSTNPVRVTAFTEDGTAKSGPDYIGVSPDTLVFPALTTTLPFAVTVASDGKDEFDEAFRVRLGWALGAVIADSLGVATILDDDTPPRLDVGDAAAPEGNADTTQVTFTLSLSAASGKPVQVLVSTADGTAQAGADYLPFTPSLVQFAADDTVLTRALHVGVLGDLAGEADETFFVLLASPDNATLGDSTAIGTIQNDDDVTGVPGAGPVTTHLGPGHPNPSRGRVEFAWGLRSASLVEIDLFDVHGRLLRRLEQGSQPAGARRLVWDGLDAQGSPLPSGIYLVRLRAGSELFQRRVVLLR